MDLLNFFSNYLKSRYNQLSKETNQDDKWHLRRFRNYLSLNNKSNLTIKNYIFDIQRFLTWAQDSVGESVFNKINENLFNEYKKSLLQKGLSLKTVKRNSSSLQKYLSWIAAESSFKSSKLTVNNSQPKRDSPMPENPPATLMQKIIDRISYSVSKIKGKPIFKDIPSVNYELSLRLEASRIRSLSPPKSNKVYHSSLVLDFFHLSLVILSVSIMGFAIYQDIKPPQEKSVLSSFTKSPEFFNLKSPNEEVTEEENLKDRILARFNRYLKQGKRIITPRSKIVSPIAKIHQTHTNIISPLGAKPH